MDLKPHLPAKFAERIDVAGSFVSEVKVVALMDFAGAQSFLQNLVGKLVRSHQRQVARERKEQDGVNSGRGQQPQFLRRRGEKLKSGVRTQDASGMRLEGHRHGLGVERIGTLDNFAEHEAVRAVYAV